MTAGTPAALAVKKATTSVPLVMVGVGDPVATGGLMSFGPSYPGMHRRAAYFVDRILKGAKPAELPVERPTKFELVINLKAPRHSA